MADVTPKTISMERGMGDMIAPSSNGDANLNEDPDKIIQLGVEEIKVAGFDEPSVEERKVYRSCSVTGKEGIPLGEGQNSNGADGSQNGSRNTRRGGSTTSWSFSKLIRNRLLKFKCCGSNGEEDDTNSQGIELENLCETDKNEVDDADAGIEANNPLTAAGDAQPVLVPVACLLTGLEPAVPSLSST